MVISRGNNDSIDTLNDGRSVLKLLLVISNLISVSVMQKTTGDQSVSPQLKVILASLSVVSELISDWGDMASVECKPILESGGRAPAGFRGRAKSYTGWAKKPERGFEDECGRELGLQYRVGQKK